MTDVLIPDRVGRNERLQRLDMVIDWGRVDGLLANINESDVAEDLVSGDECAVYGDRACYSRERSRRFEIARCEGSDHEACEQCAIRS